MESSFNRTERLADITEFDKILILGKLNHSRTFGIITHNLIVRSVKVLDITFVSICATQKGHTGHQTAGITYTGFINVIGAFPIERNLGKTHMVGIIECIATVKPP